MRQVTVRPVASRRDLKRFVDFQYDLYRGREHWVPPLRRDAYHILDPRKNAFFEHGSIRPFLAVDASDRVVGRIAGVINGMHLKKYDDGVGFFGFFECIEDYGVASALFEAVEAWLAEQGMRCVRGPANPSLNDMAGLLVSGFDREPSILMPYNFPYYEGFLTRAGFQRAMTMWAYYIHKKYVRTDRLERGAEVVRKRNPDITIRNLDMSRFDEEARTILHIYNDAWSENWGHVPMTDAEFAHLAREMKQIVDPNIVYLLEDRGRPVAFSISLPNINQALRRVSEGRLFPLGLPKLLAYAKFGAIYECRTLLMGILREYQGRGLDVLLNLAIIQGGPKNGYDASEMSWVLDSNMRLRNAVESFGGVVDKEYALFEMPL